MSSTATITLVLAVAGIITAGLVTVTVTMFIYLGNRIEDGLSKIDERLRRLEEDVITLKATH